MPPAPTKPRTVDSRMLMSQRKTAIPAKAGRICGTDPIGHDLPAAGAGCGNRLDLGVVDFLDRFIEELCRRIQWNGWRWR